MTRSIAGFFALVAIVALAGVPLARADAPSELGRPLLRVFTPREYQADPLCQAVIQGPDDVMLIANNTAALAFDGVTWQPIAFPAESAGVMQLTLGRDGQVYAAGGNVFGRIEGPVGRKEYRPLLDRLPARAGDDVREFHLAAGGDGLVYTDGSTLGIWREEKTVPVRGTPPAQAEVFAADDAVYVKGDDASLYKIVHDELRSIATDPLLRGVELVAIESTSDGLRLLTRDRGFLTVTADGVRPYPIEADRLLAGKRLLTALRLADGSRVVVFTPNFGGSGLFLSAEGRVLGRLDGSTGIGSNVRSLATDREGGLWAGLESGLARLQWPSGITIFDSTRGVEGFVTSVAREDGVLYAGTLSGLYRLRPGEPDGGPALFEKIFAGPVYDLLAGAEGGLLLRGARELAVVTPRGVEIALPQSGGIRGANLTSANLTSADLSGADLVNARLTNATFTGADLSHADLRNSTRSTAITDDQLATAGNVAGINLSGNHLDHFNFDHLVLTGAKLVSADLSWSTFRSSDLRNVDFTDATLTSTYLVGSDLRGATISLAQLRSTGFDWRGMNLTGRNWSHGDLHGLYLIDADLSGNNLKEANLSSSDLSGANLSGANLFGANLTNTNFSGTNLDGTDLRTYSGDTTGISAAQLYYSASFIGANLAYTNLAGSQFTRRNFSSTDLTNVNLSGADVSRATFAGADLTQTNFTHASLYGASVATHRLTTADFTGADLTSATLGDATRSDGFVYDGRLDLTSGTTTLASAGRASLGYLTSLSYGSTLAPAHGIELAAGRTLSGSGTIATPNTLADASVLHGSVQGSGLGGFVFTGYLQGNAVYTGALTFKGTLALSGSATNLPGNTGAVTLDGATVFLAAATAATARPLTLAAAGATLSTATGATLTLDSVISGAGGLTIAGTGTTILRGNNSYSGGTTLAGGTTEIARDAGLGLAWDSYGGVTFDGGTLHTTASFTSTRFVTLADGGGTFDVAGGTTLGWNGGIAGTGSLTKLGTGTLLLGGPGTYTGDTFVEVGTVRLIAPVAFNSQTTVHVAEGATFDTNGYSASTGTTTGSGTINVGGGYTQNGSGVDTFTGNFIGSGAFTMNGTGTVIWTGQNTYAGGTFINNGTLELAEGGSIYHPNSRLTIGWLATQDATVRITRGSLTAGSEFASTIGDAGLGALVVAGAESSATFSGPLAVGGSPSGRGSITITGAGSNWTDTGWNTTVGYGAEGHLTVADGGSFSSTGSFMLGGWLAKGIATVTGTGSTLSAAALYVGTWSEGSLLVGDGGSVVTSNTTIGDGGTGTLTVADGGSFSASQLALGSQSGSHGVLNIGAPVGSTATAAGSVAIGWVISGDGSALINFNHTDRAFAFSTELNSAITLAQNGPGTTLLTATGYSNYFYYGALVVNAGTLRLENSLRYANATVNAGGTFGGNGTVGRLTVNAGGTLAPGASPGTLHAGNTTIAGDTTFRLELNDASGAAGTNWDLLAISGTLAFNATGANPLTLGYAGVASAVPEPSTYAALAGLAALGLAFAHRRRRR